MGERGEERAVARALAVGGVGDGAAERVGAGIDEVDGGGAELASEVDDDDALLENAGVPGATVLDADVLEVFEWNAASGMQHMPPGAIVS